MRTILLTLLALTVGFGLGWVSRPASATGSRETAGPAAPAAPATAPARLPSANTAASAAVTRPGEISSGDRLRQRLETLRWLRQVGTVFHFDALTRDAFSPTFSKVFELTPGEMTRLNEAVLGAKRELEAASAAKATPRTSEDGKTLIVDVPGVDVSTSRASYDRLVETIKSTLGPERYEAFNELAGENFERSFDQFGLNKIRYELVLEPKYPFPGGPAVFEYKRHFLDATGAGRGSSTNTVPATLIGKSDPILARFLPPDLRPAEQPQP